MPAISLGREAASLVQDHWASLLLAIAYFIYLAVGPLPHPRKGAAQRPTLLPPDLGVVPLLVWASFVTAYTHAFFMWGHGPAYPAAIWGEAVSFVGALVTAGVILILEGAALEVAARRAAPAQRSGLSGLALTLRVLIVGTVFFDWAMAILLSTGLLLGK